ncbi:hypothetical protein RSPO_m01116 (plasmid) [Ralstonia solanacearum Po82]|uniref:Uncharacterized protein n=1 Tax=Ralstonia solanacearum (strain Po82) TaxID=1031711 RepID=F6G9G5_RALS8|nr:hypothetical protein RSPO_m01116 [Ralstonia solanacearum Po82]
MTTHARDGFSEGKCGINPWKRRLCANQFHQFTQECRFQAA